MAKENENSNSKLMEKETRLAPAAAPLYQAFVATIPFALLIGWFLLQARQRLTYQCIDGQDDRDCSSIRLIDMAAVCLVLAQLWACLAVYLSFFVPKRYEVILEYLEDGRTMIGDVFYEEERTCGKLSNNHYGHVVYPHPNMEVDPVHVRKQVHVLQRYTRERAVIVFLSHLPLSGQPKADLEHDLAVCKRNKSKIFCLATISWLWAILSAVAPVYLLSVAEQVELETTNFDSDSLWIMYSLVVGLVIPTMSITLNLVIWKTYYHWLTKRGKIVEEGEKRHGLTIGWFASDSASEYHPPISPLPPRVVD